MTGKIDRENRSSTPKIWVSRETFLYPVVSHIIYTTLGDDDQEKKHPQDEI